MENACGPTAAVRQPGVWQQIDDLVDGVARTAREAVTEEAFYAQLLDAALRAGAAQAAAVWAVDGGQLQLQQRVGLDDPALIAELVEAPGHRSFLQETSSGTQPRFAAPGGRATQAANPTPSLLVACPVLWDGRPLRVVEVLQRPEVTIEAQRGYAAILATLCGLAGDFHRCSELRRLQSQQRAWSELDHFGECVHSQLDSRAVAYCIANEGRRIVGCERLSLAVRRRRGFSILAISGLDLPAPRANLVRRMQQLVEPVALLGQPLWYGGGEDQLAPEIESAVRDYVDLAHARTLAVVPLASPADDSTPQPAVIGVLIFESFTAQSIDDEYRRRVQAVARHAGLALSNAERYSRLPLARWQTRWASWTASRRWPAWGLGLLLLVATAAALSLVPVELAIPCQGTLQPQQRRRVFAPLSGQIERLHVEHGQHVREGQLLAEIESSELAYEFTRISGEIQTAAEELNAVQAARLGAARANDRQRDEAAQLAADEQRLTKQLETLAKQRLLLEAQQAKQRLVSPLAGQVLTWQVSELLEGRPVERGQLLLTIGDTAGPWVLELAIADRDVQVVRQAQQELGPDLEVLFYSVSAPSERHRGRLEQISAAVEPGRDRQLAALASVRVDSEHLAAPQAGSGVAARIYCGRRSAGYVWLRDLIGAVRRWLFV